MRDATAREQRTAERGGISVLDAVVEATLSVCRVSIHQLTDSVEFATQSHPNDGFEFSESEYVLGRVINGERLGPEAMAKGKVDFFNDTGGYGFIETEDHDEDVFFHMEDVGGPDLEEGTEIEFEIEDAPKGPRAKNVTRL